MYYPLRSVLKKIPGLGKLGWWLNYHINSRLIPETSILLKKRWNRQIGNEIRFWDRWLRKKGWIWSDQYNFRIRHDTEIQPELAALLPPNYTKGIKILDVGAGPLTTLGKRLNGVELDIYATDALANFYDDLLKRYKIVPPVRTQTCNAEELTEIFEDEFFDLIFCQNALDHAYDPIRAIDEMIKIVKNTGIIFLQHIENEAVNEGYQGLHLWNFTIENGDFVIWNPKRRENISQRLSDFCVEVRSTNGSIVVVIKHKI